MKIMRPSISRTNPTSAGDNAKPQRVPFGNLIQSGHATGILCQRNPTLTPRGVASANLSGQNPMAPENLKQSITSGAATGALSVPFEMSGPLPFTKTGRAAVNLSLGAQARDVTYGNPAKGLLNEGISKLTTGDFEAYKDALRQVAAVNAKINQIVPQLNTKLAASSAQIPIADAIDQPLEDAAIDVIRNPAMTQTEKDTAIHQLGGLRQSIHHSLPQGATTATPSQFQAIKQAIGDRVNWGWGHSGYR
jgi:hypothetical protein